MNHLIPAAAPFLLAVALVGCGGPSSTDCADEAKIEAYADLDGDGYGDPHDVRRVCAIEAGVVANADDCDDRRTDIHPRALEQCDAIDNDCDGDVDEALSVYAWYLDADGDGVGDADFSILACAAPPSYVAEKGDCDDNNPLVTPGRFELCDGIDNDCDGRVDDADTNLDPATAGHYWDDADGDGYGSPHVLRLACEQPANTVQNADDCDDGDPGINPDGHEICNGGVDDDCNGVADDDDPGLDLSTQFTWYADSDGDGFGDPASATATCAPPVGYVENGHDCDDSDPQGPFMRQWIADADGDGYGVGQPTAASCAPPTPVGWMAYDPALPLDCDDGASQVHPKANDTCADGIDQNCDGVDESCIADTCAQARTEVPLATGFHVLGGGLKTKTDNISLSPASYCTRSATKGQEGILKVRLQPGEVLTAALTGDTDMVMYLTRDCDAADQYDYWGGWYNCLAGGNGVAGIGTENLSFLNEQGGVLDAYLVVDCKDDCSTFQLEVDIAPAASFFLPDSCWTASSAAPLTTGAYAFGGTLDPSLGDDMDLGWGNPCTGYDTMGPEVLVPVKLQPGEEVYLWYVQWLTDGSIYALTNCDDPWSCVTGADDFNTSPDDEELWYTNTTGAPLTLYLGLDCYDYYWCDHYSARVLIR